MGQGKEPLVPVIEVGFSFISIGLAIVLFGSPNLFDEVSNVYAFFGELAPEHIWGSMFVAAAGLKILGLLTRKKRLRKLGLIASAVIYGLISAGYFLGMGWFSIGFFTYSSLAFMALFAVREVDVRDV